MKKRMIIIVIIFMIIVSSVITYSYSNQIENTVNESSYPSEVKYDFESDIIGNHPEGFSGWKWDGTEVITWEKDISYGQVAELANRNGEGVELKARYKKAKRGIIEFDIYCDFNERVGIDITQLTEEYDPVDDICISLSDSAIKIKDGTGRFVKVLSFSVDTWYHFKIEFTLESWKLWIDGNRITDDYRSNLYFNFNYYETPEYFCELYFSTYTENNKFYVDNVKISVIEVL